MRLSKSEIAVRQIPSLKCDWSDLSLLGLLESLLAKDKKKVTRQNCLTVFTIKLDTNMHL